MNLGSAIKEVRKIRKIKQITLAKKVGISQTALSYIENGHSPNPSSLKLIAKALKVPLPMLYIMATKSEDIKPALRTGFKKKWLVVQNMAKQIFFEHPKWME